MKCPKCNVDLAPATRHKLKVEQCPSCKGMWLERQELDELEDEVFDWGDDAKGSMALSSTPTTAKCPVCDAPLNRFRYRFFDLELEFCGNQHGYWLDADEDTRVLELMKKEEADYKRKVLAEDRWATTLKHMRSGSFMDKVRNLFR